jgi:two-component system sensor histidine kinase BaeS
MPPGARRFAGRLSIVTVDGRLLSGHQPAPDVDDLLDQAIVVGGQVVAIARIEPGPPAPQGVDAAFLARQYRGILLSGLALVGLAVAGAAWVGRRWLRPVQEARQAAHRIAEGAFDTRLVPRGNDELAGLAQDINAMAGSLQQLEASRRRWIAELSHEMRTPLAVLRGEVECLIDGLRPLDGAALLSLHAEVARLTRLVDDFHHLALSDLRALPCSFAPLDAGELVQQAVARFGPRAGTAGLTLTCELPPAPPPARWDHQRIGQLLDNLLENSVRYTNAPGRIRLALQASGTEARLTLDDSAPGVDSGSQARLFEPLFRADASRSRLSGGSGLGLAIAQAIVRSHGGRISATTSSLGGLRIEANLPLVPEGA